MIKRAILATILIALGVMVNLILGPPIGPFLFAFGLIAVCTLRADLFTGKCGYLWKTDRRIWGILTINIIGGYLLGLIIGWCFPALHGLAVAQLGLITNIPDWSYFISSIFCGMIMFMAVEMYKRDNILGIIYGIPLFIFCGFRHCIADIITLGIAGGYYFYFPMAIFGNLLGSAIIKELIIEGEL